MGIEEDLFGALKYANLSGGADPTKMIHQLLVNMEVRMLKQMRAQIDLRMKQIGLEQKQTKSDPSMDPFQILGVDANSTKEQVDQAYKQKAQAMHPDKGGNVQDMVKLNAAYEAICLFKGWKK